MHHWGRYAIVAVLTLAVIVPLSQHEATGWNAAATITWALLMGWLYEVWVRKD